jgi:hypothetical protein
VKHGRKEYSYYDYQLGETFHVNTVEGFWRLFKASVRSTHVQISPSTCSAICQSSLSARTTASARTGCLIFWLGRCDAPHYRIELSAIDRADALGFSLRDKLRQSA